jgi:hypothetical protein
MKYVDGQTNENDLTMRSSYARREKNAQKRLSSN